MPNPENITNHNRNPERQRLSATKGGKAKSVCKALNKRKWCNGKCPIYPCFAEPFGQKKLRDEVTGKTKCALKQMPSKLQKLVSDLYGKGEVGFNSQIIERLTELGVNSSSSNDPKEMRLFLRDLIEAKKSVFGDKQRIEANVNAITSVDFKDAFDELKEFEKNNGDSGASK